MKFQYLFFLLSFALLFNACKDDGCQSSREQIESLKIAYENSPTAANCFAYASALDSYLRKSCKNPDQIFYDKIFESYLTALPCYVPGGGIDLPTCDDGIQNGDEEGVDCGGSFCTPCPPPPPLPLNIRFQLDGVSYDITDQTGASSSGVSSLTDYTYSTGGVSSTVGSGALSFNFYQSSTIGLSNFQSLVSAFTAVDMPGTTPFANIDLTIEGVNYTSVSAGNNFGNASLIVLSSVLESSETVGGALAETYRVKGIFNCELVDGAGGTFTLSSGSFELLFANKE